MDNENPEEELKDAVKFLEGINPENVTTEIWSSLNKLYLYVSHLVNYKYHLLLYRLMRKIQAKGSIDMHDLIDSTGFSDKRLYKIVSEFERKEVERLHEDA